MLIWTPACFNALPFVLNCPQKAFFVCLFATVILFIYFFNFLLYLIYNVLSISAVQQSDPVIHIYIHSFVYAQS